MNNIEKIARARAKAKAKEKAKPKTKLKTKAKKSAPIVVKETILPNTTMVDVWGGPVSSHVARHIVPTAEASEHVRRELEAGYNIKTYRAEVGIRAFDIRVPRRPQTHDKERDKHLDIK